jgi:hypothetical protein
VFADAARVTPLMTLSEAISRYQGEEKREEKHVIKHNN